MKIFSGLGSKDFWGAVNRAKGKDHDILYEYGCKAQEMEAENKRLKEFIEYIQSKNVREHPIIPNKLIKDYFKEQAAKH